MMCANAVFEKTNVSISASFLDKMPPAINKEQFFGALEDLKFVVKNEDTETCCLEGSWESVLRAQTVLQEAFEKWRSDLNNPEPYVGYDDGSDKLRNQPEPQCQSSDVSASSATCLYETQVSSELSNVLEGIEVQNSEELPHTNNVPLPTLNVTGANDVEAIDSPIENEVYMDIKLEHNYNDLKSAENNETAPDISDLIVENEIYMDIKLSKTNNEIFTDPNLPVTLVVAKEDEPGIEVVQLNVNKEKCGDVAQKKTSAVEKKEKGKEEQLKYRKKKYEEEAPFKYFCNQCSFKTKRHSHMLKHSRLHEKVCTIYSCDQCEFSTVRASHLQRHIGSHKTEVFACSECTYSTHVEALLSKHQRLKHVANQKEDANGKDFYQCLQCDYVTRSEKYFQRHRIVHLNKDKSKACLKCSSCDYQTPSRSNYYRHLATVHGDVRPHMCTICGLCFKRPDTLTQHQATHTGTSESKSFACNQCEKAYRSSNSLKEHLLTHQEERRYLCEICAASFKTRAVQRKHFNQKHVHTKTNSCLNCSKSFKSKFLLKRHMKVHASKSDASKTSESRKSISDQMEWCDSITPATSTSDVQVIVVHQESQQSELSVQEGPLFQVTSSLVPGQAISVPVIPMEYVMPSSDMNNDSQNCVNIGSNDSHIQSNRDIIALTFVTNDS